MRRRILISSLAILAFLLFVFVYTWLRPGEPRYGGKPISYWAKQYADSQYALDFSYYSDATEATQASNAIHQIGVAAIPYALDRLCVPTDVPTDFNPEGGFFERLAFKIDKYFYLDTQQGHAIFSVLRSNASSAIPELTKLLYNSNSAFAAASALSSIGAPGIAVLCTARTQSVGSVRMAGMMGLANLMEHPDLKIKAEALRHLMQTNGDPVPQMALDFAASSVIGETNVISLAKLEPSTTLVLTNLLSSTILVVREEASNLLHQIHQSTTNSP